MDIAIAPVVAPNANRNNIGIWNNNPFVQLFMPAPNPGLPVVNIPPAPAPGIRISLACNTAPQPNGVDNCCGQVAVATACDVYGIRVMEDELRAMNSQGIFTSPFHLTSFLNSRCGAEQHNRGSVDDLVRQIDAGRPAVVLVDSGGTPHWVTVTGYEKNQQGEITHIEVRDHLIGGPCSMVPTQDFMALWSKPMGNGTLGMLTRYERLWIETGGGPNRFSISPFRTATEDLVASCLNHFSNWKSPSDLFRGVCEFFPAVTSALFTGSGRLLERGGISLQSYGDWLRGNDNRFTRLAGRFCQGAGILVESGGELLQAGGNFVAATTNTICDGISTGYHRAKNWIKSLF